MAQLKGAINSYRIFMDDKDWADLKQASFIDSIHSLTSVPAFNQTITDGYAYTQPWLCNLSL
jgi:hypothetical protein